MQEGEHEPAAFVVVQGTVFTKVGTDPTSGKIAKATRKVGTRVFATGRLWIGPQGGTWAELDVSRGMSPGWMLVEGPGFGFHGPLLAREADPVAVQVKGGNSNETLADMLLPASVTIAQLKSLLSGRTGLNKSKMKLTKKTILKFAKEIRGGIFLGPEHLQPEDILKDAWSLSECNLSGPLSMVYVGDFNQDYDLKDLPAEAGYHAEKLSEPGPEEAELFITAPASDFEVVTDFVSVRSKPQTTAPSTGGLARGDVVFGTPYKVDGEPWLRIGKPEKPSWVLIHGGSLGLGQILRVVGVTGGVEELPKDTTDCASYDETQTATAAEVHQRKGSVQEQPEAAAEPSAFQVHQHKGPEWTAEVGAEPQDFYSSARPVQSPPAPKPRPTREPPAPEAKTARSVHTRPKNPRAWNSQEVAGFIEDLGLGRAAAAAVILEQAVDGRVLAELGEDDLTRELGLHSFGAKKVLLYFQDACEEYASWRQERMGQPC